MRPAFVASLQVLTDGLEQDILAEVQARLEQLQQDYDASIKKKEDLQKPNCAHNCKPEIYTAGTVPTE